MSVLPDGITHLFANLALTFFMFHFDQSRQMVLTSTGMVSTTAMWIPGMCWLPRPEINHPVMALRISKHLETLDTWNLLEFGSVWLSDLTGPEILTFFLFDSTMTRWPLTPPWKTAGWGRSFAGRDAAFDWVRPCPFGKRGKLLPCSWSEVRQWYVWSKLELLRGRDFKTLLIIYELPCKDWSTRSSDCPPSNQAPLKVAVDELVVSMT